MTTECGIDRRQFLQRAALASTFPWWPQTNDDCSTGNDEITLGTWPHHLYKDNDGVLEPAPTESFAFNLLVKDKRQREIQPSGARLEFYSAAERVHTVEFSKKALEAIRSKGIATREDGEPEMYDFRHYFSLPVSLAVDRLVYELRFIQLGSAEARSQLEIPLLRYEQKTRLIFPIKEKFLIGMAHDFNEPHSDGRSQHYAYDIEGTGPHWEVTRNGGARNEDIYTWGREIIAPADGTVVYARNDVPDQPAPGTVDPRLYQNVPDGPSIPGNHVLLDHGNGEYSSLGHMQRGTVRVKTGDHVKQVNLLGQIGSSGGSPFPHLHYQLQMPSGLDFRADGLPARFENISFDLMGKPMKIASPKRGIFMEAH
jgi:murein DD-endopeptidase MepM/ murein hydrolase activator NlpD